MYECAQKDVKNERNSTIEPDQMIEIGHKFRLQRFQPNYSAFLKTKSAKERQGPWF